MGQASASLKVPFREGALSAKPMASGGFKHFGFSGFTNSGFVSNSKPFNLLSRRVPKHSVLGDSPPQVYLWYFKMWSHESRQPQKRLGGREGLCAGFSVHGAREIGLGFRGVR